MKYCITLFLLLNSLFSVTFGGEEKKRAPATDLATARAMLWTSVTEPKNGFRYVILTSDRSHFLRYNAGVEGPHDWLEVVPLRDRDLLTIMKNRATNFRIFTKRGDDSTYPWGGSYGPETAGIVAPNQRYLSARPDKEKPEDTSWPMSLEDKRSMWEEIELVREKDALALRTRHGHFISFTQVEGRMVAEQRDAISDWERVHLFEIPFDSGLFGGPRVHLDPVLMDSLGAFSADLVNLVGENLYEKADSKLDYTVNLSNHMLDLGIFPPSIDSEIGALMTKWSHESPALKFFRQMTSNPLQRYYRPSRYMPELFNDADWQTWKGEMATILPKFKEKIEAEERRIVKKLNDEKLARERQEFLARWPAITYDGCGALAYTNKAAAELSGVVFSERSVFEEDELVVIFSEVCGHYIYARYRGYSDTRGLRYSSVRYSTTSGPRTIDISKIDVGKIPVVPSGESLFEPAG